MPEYQMQYLMFQDSDPRLAIKLFRQENGIEDQLRGSADTPDGRRSDRISQSAGHPLQDMRVKWFLE
jgi:hypothetical protein